MALFTLSAVRNLKAKVIEQSIEQTEGYYFSFTDKAETYRVTCHIIERNYQRIAKIKLLEVSTQDELEVVNYPIDNTAQLKEFMTSLVQAWNFEHKEKGTLKADFTECNKTIATLNNSENTETTTGKVDTDSKQVHIINTNLYNNYKVRAFVNLEGVIEIIDCPYNKVVNFITKIQNLGLKVCASCLCPAITEGKIKQVLYPVVVK